MFLEHQISTRFLSNDAENSALP